MRAAMAQYSCPPGSAIVFTESLLHAANDWRNLGQSALRRVQLLQFPVGPMAPAQPQPRDHRGHAA